MNVTVCVRAGCGRETAALASFDRENLVVRLRNIDSDPAFTIGLCEIHVGRLTVPLGWTLAEERSDALDEGSSLPTPRGEKVDTSEESSTPRRPSSPEGGLLSRAFRGPESDSQTKRRQSWLEGNPDGSSHGGTSNGGTSNGGAPSDGAPSDGAPSDGAAEENEGGNENPPPSSEDGPPAEQASASVPFSPMPLLPASTVPASTVPSSTVPSSTVPSSTVPSSTVPTPGHSTPLLPGSAQSGLFLGQARGFLPPN